MVSRTSAGRTRNQAEWSSPAAGPLRTVIARRVTGRSAQYSGAAPGPVVAAGRRGGAARHGRTVVTRTPIS
ncbi:hypothetical protein GCM10010371_23860 [Streptomyces subrutilus]|uniref:Uncharacterized protein n=1 Tax=Streptomyces subrutilus TaxID=36818 RepID=A0A918V3D8_9ACTN|nr:hypothetical protein GCM10010371_23860 [Streptomyces subrutilus]